MKKTEADVIDVETMPVAEFHRRLARGRELARELRDLFPGQVLLTGDERIHSDGRFRDGESDALRVVLDGVDLAPHYFTALADKDEGHDPERFETELLRDRLARRDLLNQLAAELEPSFTALTDTVLHLGSRVRPAALAAYRIAKSISSADRKLSTVIAPAIDFFGRPARRAAETRASKKAAPPNG
jgi:hypothetical protein